MQVRLVNVGLVRDATVELTEFCIVMGPNNSGKSTIAASIYAVVKCASSFNVEARYRRPVSMRLPGRAAHLRPETDELEMVRKLAAERNLSRDSLQDMSSIVSERVLRTFGRSLVTELEAAFGAPLSTLATRGRTGRRLPLRIYVTSEQPSWIVEIRLRGESASVSVTINSEIDIEEASFAPFFFNQARTASEAPEASYLLLTMAQAMGSALFSNFPSQAHYLPAARAGLLQSHRLVAAAMFQRTPMVGLGEVSMPALSGVVADFVSEILLSAPRKQQDRGLEKIAQDIERSVLRGSVNQVDSGTGYPEIEFEDAIAKYPIHRTSSMVSELAPIVLLLRRVVEPGDLIIIEEPESHLHPHTQTTLARILFEMSARTPTFITTHSDFFLSQVNIEIRRRELGKDLEIFRKVSAYWTQVGEDGSVLRPLPVDMVDGIPEDSFAEVAGSLYDQQLEQQFSLTQHRDD